MRIQRQPEVRQLRYFVAVAEHGSFTQAATALHMTQPPLTRQIRDLETGLGIELFTRGRSGTRLTTAGEYYLQEAKELLRRLDEIGGYALAVSEGRRGSIGIGFTSTALYGELPNWIRGMRSNISSVCLSLIELTLPEQLSAIRSKRIDIGIALNADIDAELDRRVVGTETLVTCLPANHPLAQEGSKRPLRVSALGEESFVGFPRDLAPRLFDSIVSYLADNGISFRIVQEAVQMQTIIGLVSSGLGIAVVPSSMAQLVRPGVAYRRLSPRPPNVETHAIWSRENENPALSVVLEFISM